MLKISVLNSLQIYKESWSVFKKKWLLLLPFVLVSFLSNYIGPLYDFLFLSGSATTQDISYLIVLSLGILLGFLANAGLFIQGFSCLNSQWVSYQHALKTSFIKTPKLIIGYCLITLILLFGLFVSNSVISSVNNLFIKLILIVFFLGMTFFFYTKYCLYYPKILLSKETVLRSFSYSSRLMRNQDNRLLTMFTLIGIPIFYFIVIFLPVTLFFYFILKLDFYQLDVNVLSQIFTLTNQNQPLTPLMQTQKELFLQILQNYSYVFSFAAAAFKSFIYLVLGLLYKQVSSSEVTNPLNLESIKV